jgi:hypothetical protein
MTSERWSGGLRGHSCRPLGGQLGLDGTESIVAAGSVRRPGRRGRPPIKGARITSVELRPSERALLEELALITDTSYAAIFRRGLRLAAREAGLVSRGEVGEAA